MNVERPLPCSIDAEKAILGAVFLDNSCFYQAASILLPSDFSIDSHRRIFERMHHLVDKNVAIDFVTLSESFRQDDGGVQSVGGVSYICSLTDGLPRVKNIEQYAQIVKDKSMLRSLIHANTVSMADAYDHAGSAEEVISAHLDSILKIVNSTYKGQTLDDMSRATLLKLEEMRKSERECIGASSGVNELDLLTTGFREGEVVVVGARPGHGKTALVCQGIRKNLNRGMKTGFFSAEIPTDQVLLRIACMDTAFEAQRTGGSLNDGIAVFDTRDPRVLLDEDYYRLQNSIAFIPEQWRGRFFIDDTPCIHINTLVSRARAWIAKGVKLIYVDYLQLLESDGESEYEKVTNSMKKLWSLARSTGAMVVILSQLKRIPKNDRPTMADLRSSGMIEAFAQVIVFLWRDLVINDEGEIVGASGKDEILLAKQRSGPAHVCIKSEFLAKIGVWIATYRAATASA